MTSVKSYAALAFDTLYSHLMETSPIPFKEICQIVGNATSNPPIEHFPLFVTWNVMSYGQKELRGCIGNFSKLELPRGVKEYAIVAAFEDPRFPAIVANELNKLSCSVTLLKNFEKAHDCYDWELGKNGIRILINGQRTATFLPDVATEFGWTKDETLQHLVRKAGYHQDWKDLQIELTRYEGIKDSFGYKEYLALRDSVESKSVPK